MLPFYCTSEVDKISFKIVSIQAARTGPNATAVRNVGVPQLKGNLLKFSILAKKPSQGIPFLAVDLEQAAPETDCDL